MPRRLWWLRAKRIASPMQSRSQFSRLTVARPQQSWTLWPVLLRPADCWTRCHREQSERPPQLLTPSEASPHFYLLQILRHLNVPPQLPVHEIAQLAGSVGLSVNQIGGGRLVAKRAQPLKQFGWVSMIAELLERRDLGANGNVVTVDLDFV